MSEVRKCLSGETNDTQTQDQKQGPIFLWKNTEKVGVYDLVDDYYDPEAPCRFARKLYVGVTEFRIFVNKIIECSDFANSFVFVF